MVEVHVNYYFDDNEKRDAFYKEAKEAGVVKASKEEEGNISYNYYLPIEEDKVIFLLEQWKDAQSVKDHGASAHYAMLSDIKAKYVLKTEITKYEDVK